MLTLAAWKVRSLLDNPRSNRPERRTALVARELARYKVDIAALSETGFSEQGQLEEVGAGYTFFWSGQTKAERRNAGVAFAIRNDIVGRLTCLPQGDLGIPRSRHWNHMDNILVRRRDRQDVLVIKVNPGADGWTEHRLVISKMRLRLKPRRRPKVSDNKLNTALLKMPAHHLHFSNELANQLASLPVADVGISVENRWCQVRDTVQSTALDVLGRARRQH
ncbi:unnamed protein product [Schistocephalus solidus]|uniref:Endonuclease/exonuclease/phosphatase domain-containing protein n=1 Tax=Schistocephalus solidus TaxID=70667 RepID=A0A3P7DCP2_SCHSO|nr:unnamed protein product [Schistocephalus solidus]